MNGSRCQLFLSSFAVSMFFLVSSSLWNTDVLGEQQADATIEISLIKAGIIVGGSVGNGTLHYQGKAYPLSIGGISVGATIGATKAELLGEVFNLNQVSDIAGIYTAGQFGAALAGGGKHAVMRNSRGVRIDVTGKQIGVELAVDLNGLEISLN